VEAYFHSFFTTALDGVEWVSFRTWPKRDWVDPRAGLKVLENRKNLAEA